MTGMIMPGDPILAQKNSETSIGIITQIDIQEHRVTKLKSEVREAADILFIKLVLKDSKDGKNYLFDTSVIKKDQLEEMISGKFVFLIP